MFIFRENSLILCSTLILDNLPTSHIYLGFCIRLALILGLVDDDTRRQLAA
jgi:hypothetical protein